MAGLFAFGARSANRAPPVVLRLLRARNLHDLENQGRKGDHHPKGDARICKCHFTFSPVFSEQRATDGCTRRTQNMRRCEQNGNAEPGGICK